MSENYYNRKDKILFTPGPLVTSRTVKYAMLRDVGSREAMFIEIIKDTSRRLYEIAGVKKGEYEIVYMQGSSTFALESVITSAVPRDKKILVVINGAYGERIAKIASKVGLTVEKLVYREYDLPKISDIEKKLKEDRNISMVAAVHIETTTGIINPASEIGAVTSAYGRDYLVDAVTTFGAYSYNINDYNIDYLVAASDKCFEGVPGFSAIFAKTEKIKKLENIASSLVLDLYDQWRYFEEKGDFRFTPPTNVMLAFHQALVELENEGGVAAREKRYHEISDYLVTKMKELGFREYLFPKTRGHVISTFLYPSSNNFSFDEFFSRLYEKDLVIYPGKLDNRHVFRIATMGKLSISDIKNLIRTIKETLEEMEVVIKPFSHNST